MIRFVLFFLFSLGALFARDTQASEMTSMPSSLGSAAVTAHLLSAAGEVEGGKSFDVYILFDVAPLWHLYWAYPGDAGLPPRVEWTVPEGWRVGEMEFSLPEKFLEPGDSVIYGYTNTAILRVRMTAPRNLPQKQSWMIGASLHWLACKDLCLPQQSSLTLTLPASASEQAQAEKLASPAFWPSPGAPPFAVKIAHEGAQYLISFKREEGCSYELFPCPRRGEIVGHVSHTQHGEYDEITLPWKGVGLLHALLIKKNAAGLRQGWFFSTNAQDQIAPPIPQGSHGWGLSLFLALLSGLLGGFILNVMPCVLPVISLKIFGFIQEAGKSRSHLFAHGLAFVAGIYLWFLGLGALVAILKSSGRHVTWAFQFQNSGFLVFVSLVVFLFALNLFGLFEIHLPLKTTTSLDLLASQKGYWGSFFQGLFATLLATPCTAPFLGSALGFAFAQSGSIIMTMFAAVATGMALPYFILSLEPAWMKWLPRPGLWMEKVKVLMGFPLLATNLWLISVISLQQGIEGVMALLTLFLILSLSAWIYGAFANPNKSLRYTTISLSLFVALLGCVVLIPKITRSSSQLPAASQTHIPWVPFSRALLEQLRSEGKPVFLDFTAAWCLTCQFNEHSVIESAPVRELIQKQGIIPMKADWTNANPEITEVLQGFGRVGVPFYVFYPANQSGGDKKPVIFSELLSEAQLLKAFSE